MTEQALCIIKPDAVRRKLEGVIITGLINTGFTFVDLARRTLIKAALRELYKQHSEKEFFEPLIEFMNSGPLYVIGLEGDNCCERLRGYVAATRSILATSVRENVIHGSDSPEAGVREVGLFF